MDNAPEPQPLATLLQLKLNEGQAIALADIIISGRNNQHSDTSPSEPKKEGLPTWATTLLSIAGLIIIGLAGTVFYQIDKRVDKVERAVQSLQEKVTVLSTKDKTEENDKK